MGSALEDLRRRDAFAAAREPYLLLDRELTITGANEAYLCATGRSLEELCGRYVFDAFPDNPDDPDADGVKNLNASLEQVLRTNRQSRMWVQRYDVPGVQPGDPFVFKYWSPVNIPVLDSPRGTAAGVLHHVTDVTVPWTKLRDSATPQLGRAECAQLSQALSVNEQVHDDVVQEVEQLREALSSRIAIEQAKGIIMAQLQCDVDEAFERLRTSARSSNLNIHDVAAAVIKGTSGKP